MEIVRMVQDNANRIDRPLWCSLVHVTAHLRDERGKEHTFNFDGNLLFQKPRNLRLHLRHPLGDEVMAVGSNADDYWVWIEPELGLLRWGRHRFAGERCCGKMPVRPDQIISALAFDGLPKAESGLIGPLRRYNREFDVLSYVRAIPEGGFRIDREYYVERVPPYLIRVVVFPDEFGRRMMSAFLEDFRAAWEGGPLVAHRVNIRWPEEDGAFTLDAIRFEGRDKVGPKAFTRPTRRELPAGVKDVVQVDASCDSPTPTTAPAH